MKDIRMYHKHNQTGNKEEVEELKVELKEVRRKAEKSGTEDLWQWEKDCGKWKENKRGGKETFRFPEGDIWWGEGVKFCREKYCGGKRKASGC